MGAARGRPRAPTPHDRGRASRTARPRRGCAPAAAERLRAPRRSRRDAAGGAAPRSDARTAGAVSTQQAFGRFFVDLAHEAPEVSAARGHRSAPTSPPRRTSAAGSTARACGASATASTGSPTTTTRWCAGASPSTASTSSWASPSATSWACSASSARRVSRDGQPLLPIGTLYDPFVNRALEQWSFGIYAGGQSILVGTPSGVTLAPEGGAHQSIITPSVGLEQPRCVAWEPAFGQDLEWMLLHALGQLGRERRHARPTCA